MAEGTGLLNQRTLFCVSWVRIPFLPRIEKCKKLHDSIDFLVPVLIFEIKNLEKSCPQFLIEEWSRNLSDLPMKTVSLFEANSFFRNEQRVNVCA